MRVVPKGGTTPCKTGFFGPVLCLIHPLFRGVCIRRVSAALPWRAGRDTRVAGGRWDPVLPMPDSPAVQCGLHRIGARPVPAGASRVLCGRHSVGRCSPPSRGRICGSLWSHIPRYFLPRGIFRLLVCQGCVLSSRVPVRAVIPMCDLVLIVWSLLGYMLECSHIQCMRRVRNNPLMHI